MAIHVQRQANVSKQTKLLDGVDVGPPKWLVCEHGLNGSVYDEGMKDISKVKVHLKTHRMKNRLLHCNVNQQNGLFSFWSYGLPFTFYKQARPISNHHMIKKSAHHAQSPE